MLATLMSGVILVGMAYARLGRLIEYVPEAVTLGFTGGIAVVIATLGVFLVRAAINHDPSEAHGTKESVIEIAGAAAEAGFADQSHMARAMRWSFGLGAGKLRHLLTHEATSVQSDGQFAP